ncbi:hypothetical protein GEV33_010123 [Tenebrio molitor]|uniref:Uncharacterized protein n=1 Tax=Tenebrio molitor TaxID=7067 RepID=A0A8J6HE05_TENMO|nr:hypothetical protein GEV33_010123 [Tenebrio molitor]
MENSRLYSTCYLKHHSIYDLVVFPDNTSRIIEIEWCFRDLGSLSVNGWLGKVEQVLLYATLRSSSYNPERLYHSEMGRYTVVRHAIPRVPINVAAFKTIQIILLSPLAAENKMHIKKLLEEYRQGSDPWKEDDEDNSLVFPNKKQKEECVGVITHYLGLSPISFSALFFYAAHDGRDRSLRPHLVSQKKDFFFKEKEVARQAKTQKINNNIRTLTKNCYRSDRPFAGRARFSKTKNLLYHTGLDRHGAVDVSGDLYVPRGLPRAHGGRRNLGVESDCALCVRFFGNLLSGIRKSAPRRLGLNSLDSPSSLTFFGPSTSPRPFLAVQPLTLSQFPPHSDADRTTNQDQEPKMKHD